MGRATPISVAVVDDDENLCRSLSRLLRAAGIQPSTYTSAEAFLARHEPSSLRLPGARHSARRHVGIELAQRLVAEGRSTPFIYITAHDDPERQARAEASGCAAYFRKTDSGTDVLEAIRRVAL